MTSDHTNLSDHQQYQTDIGGFCSPIIIYDPSQELVKPGMRNGIAQQIDILPTVLSILNYNKPFLSFGCDLMTTPNDDTYAVNYLNGIYQYVKHGYTMQFDGNKVIGMYKLTDLLMKHNLVGKVKEQAQMETELKPLFINICTEWYMINCLQNEKSTLLYSLCVSLWLLVYHVITAYVCTLRLLGCSLSACREGC